MGLRSCVGSRTQPGVTSSAHTHPSPSPATTRPPINRNVSLGRVKSQPDSFCTQQTGRAPASLFSTMAGLLLPHKLTCLVKKQMADCSWAFPSQQAGTAPLRLETTQSPSPPLRLLQFITPSPLPPCSSSLKRGFKGSDLLFKEETPV